MVGFALRRGGPEKRKRELVIMKPKLSDLWRWDGAIDRGVYLFWGVFLLLLKFNCDRTIGWLWFDRSWTEFTWEQAKLYLWQTGPGSSSRVYYVVLLATSLPFLWAGVVLTLRRLRSLGWQPWWVLFFVVPVLKLILFGLLCVLASRERSEPRDGPSQFRRDAFGNFIPHSALGSALAAVLASVGGAMALAWLATAVLGDYGWALFIGLPFCMGFLAAFIYSYHESRSIWPCLLVSNAAMLLAGLGLLLVASEGFVCILMAAPIALGLASAGSVAGYAVQNTIHWRRDSSKLFSVAILAVPTTMGLEHWAPPPLRLLSVTTSVIVNAPAEAVWRRVVAFPPLSPPREFLFRAGIAYPVSAEVRGVGAGAVRHCNFSTGTFVEPIEVWDEPRLLRFKVTANPEPMREWTPYREVHPAHLNGYLESRQGEFRLEALDGGRTLLKGTTWYHHHMWPARYWQAWSDLIIHAIHRRVLNHVKTLSEGGEP